MVHKEIEQSHVMEHSLSAAGHAGWPRRHLKRVVKNRFLTPNSKWHSGNRKNNHHK